MSSRWLTQGLSALITVLAVVWCFDLPIKFGWLIYNEQFVAAMLAIARGRIRWGRRLLGGRRDACTQAQGCRGAGLAGQGVDAAGCGACSARNGLGHDVDPHVR